MSLCTGSREVREIKPYVLSGGVCHGVAHKLDNTKRVSSIHELLYLSLCANSKLFMSVCHEVDFFQGGKQDTSFESKIVATIKCSLILVPEGPLGLCYAMMIGLFSC